MTDQKLENIVATLLRTGVILAASIVLIGGIAYLILHGEQQPSWHTFHGVPDPYRSVSGVVRAAATFDWMAVIQLGLLILIATPIARVAFALVAFALEKDQVYVAVTSLVLAILLYSVVATH